MRNDIFSKGFSLFCDCIGAKFKLFPVKLYWKVLKTDKIKHLATKPFQKVDVKLLWIKKR